MKELRFSHELKPAENSNSNANALIKVTENSNISDCN